LRKRSVTGVQDHRRSLGGTVGGPPIVRVASPSAGGPSLGMLGEGHRRPARTRQLKPKPSCAVSRSPAWVGGPTTLSQIQPGRDGLTPTGVPNTCPIERYDTVHHGTRGLLETAHDQVVLAFRQVKDEP
jgi:hypothetical protein